MTVKPLALGILALFLLSVVAIPLQASALDALTFSNGTTFTSLNSDRWQTVWTDTDQYAIIFNGSTQYAQAASNIVFDITTQDFSIVGMYYRDAASGVQEALISKRDMTSGSAGYQIDFETSNQLRCVIQDNNSVTTVETVGSLPANVWIIFGCSFDRDDSLNVWVYNTSTGALTTASGDISAESGSLTNSNTFTIARNPVGSNLFFPGRMDHLHFINNVAISQAQFTTFATTGTLPVTPTSFYDFNEGAGAVAYDRITTNNLTLFNTPTYTTSTPAITESNTTYFVDTLQGSFKTVAYNDVYGVPKASTATISASTNPSSASTVEKVSGVTRVYTAQQMSTTRLEANIMNINTGGIISAANHTLTTTAAISGSPIAVASSKNAVYYMAQGTGIGGALGFFYSLRDLTGFTTINNQVLLSAAGGHVVSMKLSTNGAATANDILYCFDGTNAANQQHVCKVTSAAVSDLGVIGTAAAITKLEQVNLSDKHIIRFTEGGTTTKLFTITKSSDAVSSAVFTESWTTFAIQPFTFDGTTLSYPAANKAYYATTEHAISYASSGTLTDPDLMFLASTSGSDLVGLSGPFYRISDSLVFTGSGTTWTPKTVTGTANTIQPVLYSEMLSVPLVQNSTLFRDDVIRLVCDANYSFINPVLAGDDSDCTQWWTFDQAGAAAARQLSYTRTKDLVHYPDYSYYTFQLTTGNPTLYELTTIYDSKDVDSGDFDSSGQLQQRLAYQQCYTIRVAETSTGNVLQTGSVCAGDDTTKTLSLTGIVIPADWLGNTWSYTLQRYFNGTEITPPNPLVNATNNMIILTFQKNTNPYNATINLVDNIFDTPTINQTYTFTNVSGASVVNASSLGILSNMTIYVTATENGVNIFNLVSAGESFDFSDIFNPNDWGLLFGIPAVFVFPFIAAAIFPKSIAYFGIIFSVAVIGIIQLFGFIALPAWFWVISMPLMALAVFIGYKR